MLFINSPFNSFIIYLI